MSKVLYYGKSRLGHDILWTFSGQLVIMLVLLGINKVLSNILTVDDFGRYNIIRRSTSVMSFVLLGGLGISMPRYLSMSVSKSHYRETQGWITASWLYLLLISLVFSFCYILLYNHLAILVVGSTNVYTYILCLCYAMTMALNSYIYAYYRGIGKFKQFNLSQIIVQVLLLVPLLCGLEKMFYIISIWTVTNFLFIVFVLLKENHCYRVIRKHFKSDREILNCSFKELFIYSFPRLIGDFFLFAYSAFPVLYIGYKIGYENASFYSVGVSLVAMVTPVFSILGMILLPTVSAMIADHQRRRAQDLVVKLSVLYIAISLFFTLILYLGMENLIKIFFAKKYLEAASIGKIISLSLLPQSLYLLYRNPNDAASVFPYNTLILAISFGILVGGFAYFDNLIQYAWVYFAVAVIQCVLSVLAWNFQINKRHEF